jgi:hypothetical protein
MSAAHRLVLGGPAVTSPSSEHALDANVCANPPVSLVRLGDARARL